MTSSDILFLRLSNQGLNHTHFKTPHETVSWLGAVQSQDYPSAKWALGQRIENATEASIDESFNKGEILRTHIMRPTWHFVTPQDIVWVQTLTSHRVKKLMTYYNKSLDLTDEIFKKCEKILVHELQNNNFKTRSQLADALEKDNIPARGQRLGHIMMWAELNAVICSGPRIGKQFSYALVLERAPKAQKKSHENALFELTKRYFQSHGPATIKDFSWWSGLTIAECTRGIEIHKPKLLEEKIDSLHYFYFQSHIHKTKQLLLLSPVYDEFTIAYTLRDLFYKPEYNPFIGRPGNALFQNTIIFEGKAIGAWKKEIKSKTIHISYFFFNKNDNDKTSQLQITAKKYAAFLNLKLEFSETSV